MMKTKRGLSNVVASILLVLLSIISVTILAGFIIPFANESLQSTNCINFRDYFEIEDSFGYSCYSNDLYGFSVKVDDNSSAGDIIGFDLTLLGEGNAVTLEISEEKDASCNEKGIRILGSDCSAGLGKLQIPGEGIYSVVTFIYKESGKKYRNIEIYPILNNKKVCDLSDSIELKPCIPSDKLGVVS